MLIASLVVVVIVTTLLLITISLSRIVKDLKRENAQIIIQQESIIDGSKNYVKLSDLKDFKSSMDSTTALILKGQRIKPRWVDELIQTTVIYNNNDTTISNTIYKPLGGIYEWKASRDCINTEGYVALNQINDSTDVKVAITKQDAVFKVTGVKYDRRIKEFRIFKKVIFRYGVKAARVISTSNCGETETIITEIQK